MHTDSLSTNTHVCSQAIFSTRLRALIANHLDSSYAPRWKPNGQVWAAWAARALPNVYYYMARLCIYTTYTVYHIRTEYTSTSLLCAITNLLPQKTKINLKIISLPTIPFHSIVLLKASTQSPFSINQYKLEVYPQTSAQDVVAQSSEPNGVQTPKLVRVNGLSPHAATTLQNPNNHSLTKLLPRTPCRHLHAMASKWNCLLTKQVV